MVVFIVLVFRGLFRGFFILSKRNQIKIFDFLQNMGGLFDFISGDKVEECFQF